MKEFIAALLGDTTIEFVLEIMGRTIIMFLMIVAVLRLSGRRGVRQLTLFEVAIILGLGSAAGDPMFQQDIPIVYALVVFACVIGVYKLMTFLAARSLRFNKLLEGKEITIVQDGMFHMRSTADNDFSQREFFAELRNHSVEHLGQVRMAVLEVDGSLSVLFYEDEEVQYGLPLFPPDFKTIDADTVDDTPIACMNCGQVTSKSTILEATCERCGHKKWAKALKTRRSA